MIDASSVLRWLAAISLALALSAGQTAGAGDDPLADRFGGPFELVADDGRRVTEKDFRGQFLLIYFGYTHCPDICPVDLSVMTEALDLAGPAAENVQPIFITVDPVRDTPESLAQYRKSFHPKLIALSGTEEEIAAVAKSYRVHRRKYVPDAKDPANYGVDHGSITYLMGPDGKFRTLFPRGTPAERMAELIKKYTAAL